MKYLNLILLFLLALSSKAQFISDEFLSADLKNSTFELRGWDEILSQKDQMFLVNAWDIGQLVMYSEADTSSKDFVVFPAKYIAKETFSGLVVVKSEDFMDLPFTKNDLLTITEDMAVLSMFMVPEKLAISKSHELLFQALNTSIDIKLKSSGKGENAGDHLSFYSFRKSIENSGVALHYMLLDTEVSKMTDEQIDELSEMNVIQLKNEQRTKNSLDQGMILAYFLPIPKSWNGEMLCSLFNTTYGVMYSESFPKTENPYRLGLKQVQQLLKALEDEKSKGLFFSKV